MEWLKSRLVLAAGSVASCFLLGFALDHAFASHVVGGPITNGGWVLAAQSCGPDTMALVFEPHRMLSVGRGEVKHLRHEQNEPIDILGDATHPQIRMWIGKEKRMALVFYAEIDGDALRFTRYEYEALGRRSGPPAKDDFFQPVFAYYQRGQPYHRCAMPAV